MPAPLYARYVPQRKSVPKSAERVPEPQSYQPSIPEESQEQSPQEKSKASRDRPKKRKREITQEAEVLSDEEITKKHKSVLSKFEKASKLAEAARASSAVVQEKNEAAEDAPAPELHDLVPLPQPELIPEAPFEPTFSALPPWLAQPVLVPAATRTPFHDLDLDSRLVDLLEKKGYKDALAVQSALLPMLRPGFQQHLGDLCVSAATGSGKTLAYLLPMVEGLEGRVVPKLSGLVIVPTRELVAQARSVAEELCVGTKLKVGVAVGNVPFDTEQDLLVKKGSKYDPEAAKALHKKANDQLRTGFIERSGVLGDLMDMLPGHIPQYDSKVDILICTPGRLVEHLQNTTGFHLRDVRWLAIDEADRLLDQSFQEWVTVLTDALESEAPQDQMTAREKLFKERKWPKHRELTKIVLSATMTKDLNKLGSLRFSRPRLVVVENDEKPSIAGEVAALDGDTFELPSTLKEYAVPVGDGSDKPLYLAHLLQTYILRGAASSQETGGAGNRYTRASYEDETSSDSDDSSSSDSEKSVSSNSTGSSTSETESSSDNSSEAPSSSRVRQGNLQLEEGGEKRNATVARVLIFTNNNENAFRLSHLLSTLHPPLNNAIGTLTKASATKESKKILAAFAQGKIQILVASDRASRGLDVPNLAHIVNYDLPRNIQSYVHRVGRTARAGKEGQAWTLYTKTEARWFWNDIARGHAIKRGLRKVERVTISAEETITEEKRNTYEAALKGLKIAVEGRTGRSVAR